MRDRLAHGVRDHVGLTAHVRDVWLAGPVERAGDRDDLVRLRVQTGRVHEPGRDTGCSVRERVLGEPDHRAQLVGGWRAIGESEDRRTDAAMPDERREVHICADPADRRAVRGEIRPRACVRAEERAHEIGDLPTVRERAEPAVAADLGRDALAKLRGADIVVFVGQERRDVAMGVGVDEAGRHDVTGRVDDLARRRRSEVADGIDAPTTDPDVGAAQGRARTVDHAAVADQEVDH